MNWAEHLIGTGPVQWYTRPASFAARRSMLWKGVKVMEPGSAAQRPPHAPCPGQAGAELENLLHTDHVILGEVLAEEIQSLGLCANPSTPILADFGAYGAALRTFHTPVGKGGVKKLYVRTRSEKGSEMRGCGGPEKGIPVSRCGDARPAAARPAAAPPALLLFSPRASMRGPPGLSGAEVSGFFMLTQLVPIKVGARSACPGPTGQKDAAKRSGPVPGSDAVQRPAESVLNRRAPLAVHAPRRAGVRIDWGRIAAALPPPAARGRPAQRARKTQFCKINIRSL